MPTSNARRWGASGKRPTLDPTLAAPRESIWTASMKRLSERRARSRRSSSRDRIRRRNGQAPTRDTPFFAYATNYLIDTENAVILDVEATRAIRQAEVGASRTMLDRTAQRFGLKPQRLAADSAYGSAANLAWLVKERQIEPHIPVFDKSNRTDGTFSRSAFVFDREENRYTCPQGKFLVLFRRSFAIPRSGITKDGTRLYRSSSSDCRPCELKVRCCPNTPQRKIPRDVDEDVRDLARSLASTPAFDRSRHLRKKIEMLFAHLKRILRLGQLRLRGPNGARDEFLLAATAQNLRKLAKLRSRQAVFAA